MVELQVRQAIHMSSICKNTKCLPGPGGLMEQDSLLIWLMTTVFEAWQMREDREMKQSEREAKQGR
jgi:hypothetical protein